MPYNKKDLNNADEQLNNKFFNNFRQNNSNPFARPPSDAKANIMKAIDFRGKNAPTFASTFNAYFRRVGIPTVSCLLLLTASFFRYGQQSGQNLPIADNRQNPVFTALSTAVSGIKYSKIPLTSSVADNDLSSTATTLNASSNLNASTSETQTDTFIADIASLNSTLFPKIAIQKESESQNNHTVSEANSALLALTPTLGDLTTDAPNGNAMRIRLNRSTSTPVTLSFRGVSAENSVSTSGIGSSISSFAAGIYTSLTSSSDLTVGLEFGCEPFAKKYFDKSNPDMQIAEKSVNAFWGAVGINYSYSGNDGKGIFAGFKPSATLLLGAGEIGPTIRTSIGISHSITSNVSAYVGFESAAMFYNNRYKWYASQNSGITAGISYTIR